MIQLNVFREQDSKYQLVGILRSDEDTSSFSYDREYLDSPDAAAISLSLPLSDAPFSDASCAAFFAGLTPEGDLRKLVSTAVHSDSFGTHLARLNDESIGGLLFSSLPHIDDSKRGLIELTLTDLTVLRDKPANTSFEMGMNSRLSLSGAQGKAGLYHIGDDMHKGWFLPHGTMPSTHIVKAPDSRFSGQTINEALCLATAQGCGFDVGECQLLDLDGTEPLLAVKRFDRDLANPRATVDDLPVPYRLHQEDFCQASGLLPSMKYEPTDGHYLMRGAKVISGSSSNPFGDRVVYLRRIFLDYLIGNCDNHLKNHSIVWDVSWQSRELSPLYDIICTTFYPQLSLEMGVSLCSSRRIDDVCADDIDRTLQSLRLQEKFGWRLYREIWECFPGALDRAEEMLISNGYKLASRIAEHIRSSFDGKVVPR